jgi:hypothetical protein
MTPNAACDDAAVLSSAKAGAQSVVVIASVIVKVFFIINSLNCLNN